jgi:hypothetical protein
MPLLSKSEVLYLQGQKRVSRSYEYKLKSIIRKKMANLRDKEIPLLSSLFPNIDLTKFGKTFNYIQASKDLTNFGKAANNETITKSPPILNKNCNDSEKYQKENTKNNSSWQIIARPRFELGSKAPKASMLVRYIRYCLI